MQSAAGRTGKFPGRSVCMARVGTGEVRGELARERINESCDPASLASHHPVYSGLVPFPMLPVRIPSAATVAFTFRACRLQADTNDISMLLQRRLSVGRGKVLITRVVGTGSARPRDTDHVMRPILLRASLIPPSVTLFLPPPSHPHCGKDRSFHQGSSLLVRRPPNTGTPIRYTHCTQHHPIRGAPSLLRGAARKHLVRQRLPALTGVAHMVRRHFPKQQKQGPHVMNTTPHVHPGRSP